MKRHSDLIGILIRYFTILKNGGHSGEKLLFSDNGCDLGLDGYEIRGKILIHHMNPIRQQDILLRTDLVLNPEYLIATTLSTHNAIHYGDEKLLLTVPNERRKNDTCPWRH